MLKVIVLPNRLLTYWRYKIKISKTILFKDLKRINSYYDQDPKNKNSKIFTIL